MKQLYLCLVAALLSFSSFAAPTPVPPPSAITGTLAICDYSTTTLSSSPSGGTWSSSNAVVATVDAATGVVTPTAAGTTTISYTDGTGYVTAIVTVNPVPPAIMGAPYLCVGTSSSLTNLVGGGSWSSTNLAVAAVDAAGLVTGYSVGTSIISYTLSTGCARTIEVTVNPVPPAITGVTTVCTGGTTTLANSAAGGMWNTDDPSILIVDMMGVVTGINPGTANVRYTLPTGCMALVPVTVSSTVTPITGTAAVCPGGTATLTNLTPGGSWSTSDAAKGVISFGRNIYRRRRGYSLHFLYGFGGCNSILWEPCFRHQQYIVLQEAAHTAPVERV